MHMTVTLVPTSQKLFPFSKIDKTRFWLPLVLFLSVILLSFSRAVFLCHLFVNLLIPFPAVSLHRLGFCSYNRIPVFLWV